MMMEATTTIDLQAMGQHAKTAARQLARLTTDHKNAALTAIADGLAAGTADILAANAIDVQAAREGGTDEIWIKDRLDLTRRMTGMIADVRKVIELADPVGLEFDQRVLDNGLKVSKRRTPLGVLGVIYEARPNVTVDVAVLALKSGNAVILRGGKEAMHSNRVMVGIMRQALATCGLPADCIQFIDSTDRDYVGQMLRLHQYIDLIIPRGGNALHTFCRENSTIPVITGGIGVCHLYVDASADLEKALPIIHNAKTQRPAVCNSVETVLVNSAVAADFLPRMANLLGEAGVVFKAEPRAYAILDSAPHSYRLDAAKPEDFDTEWYSLVLNVRVLDTLDEAIDHITAHSTQHSDGILTQDMAHAERFLNEIDSSAVYLNASTRFTDGSALGLGAEVAISTQKLHARGPMALEELTTYKWIILGDGQIRP
ncbi:MAG TPA: glutamate-5-semialdehyde dehydrogenase [Aggregatilineales bacterium]|nr:glutamate-5-semialdehyde dehydrogenase [Aggregatilineales bacterium]